MHSYDVIVIGGGHAGIEAALAASRMGKKTLLVTLSRRTIGLMSCNPAIGGVGKAQLVREIDAVGGQMARAADACGIQFRILNASKGAAVQSSRAQVDMALYSRFMQQVVAQQKNLEVRETEVTGLRVSSGRLRAIQTKEGREIPCTCAVLCPGTFLDGLIHVGLSQTQGGRINEPAAVALAAQLKELGFVLLRFKTGTCPRLDSATIDFSQLTLQPGDEPPQPFSFSTKKITRRQVPCYLTYTTPVTHRIIRENLDRSPLYQGVIKATGVRYCPSIEDKVVRFSDRLRHQVFLEPQGLATNAVYPNGLSTSLPQDVQRMLLRSIPGLEQVEVLRFGYGIEHTVVEPTQLFPTLETKQVANLYLAGQINGTTGYEEAAAQGLIAGINAALRINNKEPLMLDRSSSYIGVLLDDLTTKGTSEPYRMFTSRVEYRLLLRQDNADVRLRETGFKLGLVSKGEYLKTRRKTAEIKKGIAYLKHTRVGPAPDLNARLLELQTAPLRRKVTLEELLRRPQIGMRELAHLVPEGMPFKECAFRQVEIEVKYEGFIQRQYQEVERFRHLERIQVPQGIEYTLISGLSREIREKLTRMQPANLGQASRISGVTPAAITLLMIYLRKLRSHQ